MKRILLAIALGLAFSIPVMANGNDNDDEGNNHSNRNHNRNTNRNNNDNNNTNRNTNSNSQGQIQLQGQKQQQQQLQAQGQGQSQSTKNSNNAAQSTNVEMNTPRQAVPAGGVSAAGTTATCRIAGGVSVGAVWGGFGASGSVLDETCQAIEVAKALIWAGSNTGDSEMIKLGNHILMETAKGLVKPTPYVVPSEDVSYTQ